MNARLMNDARLSWSRVAEAVSEKLGRKYSGSYCLEVATGFRNSKTIAPILRDLGVMPKSPDRILPQVDVAASERALSGPASGVVGRVVSRTLSMAVDTADRLLRQRRTLAAHLRDALRESRALRVELEEAQNRASATALRLGAEIFDGEAIASDLRDQLDAMEQERNQLRLQLEESRLTNDRLIARLSKQVRSRRVTHIRLGNELFRNRTGANA